jgi:Concanavalin A-like lectin/glucanases superfamily
MQSTLFNWRRYWVNTGNCCVNEIVVPSPLLIGTWTHLALTFDYGTDSYALYVNGHIVGTSTEARNTPTQLLDFGGHRSNFGQNFYWNGLIDEVHVFKRVLTPSEILGLATPVVPFAAFTAKVKIELGPRIDDAFELQSRFTLGAGSDGINLAKDQVTLELTGGRGSFTTTFPMGSLKQDKKGRFTFEGIIDGVSLKAEMTPLGGTAFAFEAEGEHASLTGIANPLTVKLTIGNDGGSTTVTAKSNDDHDAGE